jgi:hypothetical protein
MRLRMAKVFAFRNRFLGFLLAPAAIITRENIVKAPVFRKRLLKNPIPLTRITTDY